MSPTSRELVRQTLACENPVRAPRHLWVLPWAQSHHGEDLAAIQDTFPDDIIQAPGYLKEVPKTEGDPYKIGRYVDDWGAVFENIQDGVIGEVKETLVKDWDTDIGNIHIPREWLTIDIEKVNQFCGETDKFVLAGCCPRPFEQTQFIRGTADLYIDLMMQPPAMMAFLNNMHTFYCELLEIWAKTDVDALIFMDDWGSQQSLLINPEQWKEMFKPMYRDYIEIAHGAGKKIFMHSDGNILQIYPELIDIGLDAINSQLFCMGLDKLKAYAGKITFWGEIDRQHLLPEGSVEDNVQAVREVYARLWKGGGCIAQCEFGPGAKPENVRAVFDSWDAVSQL